MVVPQKLRPRPSAKAPGILESAAYQECEHLQNAAQRRITACGAVLKRNPSRLPSRRAPQH